MSNNQCKNLETLQCTFVYQDPERMILETFRSFSAPFLVKFSIHNPLTDFDKYKGAFVSSSPFHTVTLSSQSASLLAYPLSIFLAISTAQTNVPLRDPHPQRHLHSPRRVHHYLPSLVYTRNNPDTHNDTLEGSSSSTTVVVPFLE